MKSRTRFLARPASFAAAACLVLAACQAGSPTPIFIVTTPTPEASVEVTDSPTPKPTLVPTATPSAGVTASESASPSTSASPTPTPSPTPTSRASFCSGNADNKAFFAQAAKILSPTVFCATALSSGWRITGGTYTGTGSGGWLDATYKYKTTSQTFQIKEGAFCLGSFALCTGGSAFIVIRSGSFGTNPGPVVAYGTNSYAILIRPGQANAYFLIGHNISADALASVGANMKAVPKS